MIRTFESNATGRVITISLGRGDDLLKSIEAVIAEKNIEQGVVVSGIGALMKASYHRVMTTDHRSQNEFITIEAPIELGSLQGMIVEGQPHIHMTFSDLENTYAGHLEYGSEVLYIGEIVIMETKGPKMGRRKNEYGTSILVPVE